MATTQDLLRQRFVEACAERDAILAKAEPLREKRDALIAKIEADMKAKVEPIDAQIKDTETGLSDIMKEIAQISTALNGQTA
jgi:uncharacterized coiled-coil DUF342 family protein